jgi:hypothetical protein
MVLVPAFVIVHEYEFASVAFAVTWVVAVIPPPQTLLQVAHPTVGVPTRFFMVMGMLVDILTPQVL